MNYHGNLAGQVHATGAKAQDLGVDFVESSVGGEWRVLMILEGVTVGSVMVTHGIDDPRAGQLCVTLPRDFLRSDAGRSFLSKLSELAR